MYKSGFVTIIGEPNVGKSTFLNQVLKQKVAIVSDKPQTTRDLINGIYTTEDCQLVFIDTPGIHHGTTKLGKYMSAAALSTVKAVDLVLYFVNSYEDVKPENLAILAEIRPANTPVFLIVNKIDAIKDFPRLKENIELYKKAFAFAGVFAIGARDDINISLLLEDIKKLMPEGPMFYPDGIVTDRPETFLIRELIREKILELTREEIPHSVMVQLESMKRNKNNNVMEIHAAIIVERTGQKSIIIGQNGEMIKNIGTLARIDIEALIGRKVYLELFCKVESDWRNREYYLKDFGYKPEHE